MKLLLIFPPAADPAHPPLGITSLAGFILERGFEVSLLDLNLRAYNDLLSSSALASFAGKMRNRLDKLERQSVLAYAEMRAYGVIAENLLSAQFLIDNVDDARQRLRDPATYSNRCTYGKVTSVIRRAMQFISAAYYPANWTPGGFSMSYQCTRSADVLAATADREENLFLHFFESSLPEIVASRPTVVGISVNYYGQLIPAMTLASLVKQQVPEAFIVVGGGLISFFDQRWEVLDRFKGIVNGWIPYEGEKPLLALLKALENGDCPDTVPGLLRFENGVPRYQPAGAPPAMTEIPLPNFNGLPLTDYLAPEAVLPLLTSRGCYWGRCAFCSHAHLYRDRMRSRSVSEVVGDVSGLSRKYGANCFYFVDEAIQPKIAIGFATEVAARNLSCRWFSEARFEQYFDDERLKQLHAGGCRMLIFGLESGVNRLLELMDKGITAQTASGIISGCAKAGIRSFVMFFNGFPTETREEAQRTVDFIEAHRDKITHIATGRFLLEPQSRIFRERRRFGVTDVSMFAEDDLKTWCQYSVQEGQTSLEAAEFATEIARRKLFDLSEFYLISRSHLVFLPPLNEDTLNEQQQAPPMDLSKPARMVPVRSPGLIPHVLAFNLDEIRKELGEEPPGVGELAANPTHYVFCPERELLVEVGSDGIALLKTCNGQFSLEEILAAVGDKNRQSTILFFKELEERQFISWDTRE